MAVKEVTYEEKRKHIKNLIYDSDDITLSEVSDKAGHGDSTTDSYQYVWQVLTGDYGKSKRSPKVLSDLEKALKEMGHWEDI